MPDILSYHVFNSETRKWLSDDEKSWTGSFPDSASFSSFDLADAIMAREGGDYIFACMASAGL